MCRCLWQADGITVIGVREGDNRPWGRRRDVPGPDIPGPIGKKEKDYAVDSCGNRSGCCRCATVAGQYLPSDGCQDKENSKHRRCDRGGPMAIACLRDPGLPLGVSHREVNFRGTPSYYEQEERGANMKEDILKGKWKETKGGAKGGGANSPMRTSIILKGNSG